MCDIAAQETREQVMRKKSSQVKMRADPSENRQSETSNPQYEEGKVLKKYSEQMKKTNKPRMQPRGVKAEEIKLWTVEDKLGRGRLGATMKDTDSRCMRRMRIKHARID